MPFPARRASVILIELDPMSNAAMTGSTDLKPFADVQYHRRCVFLKSPAPAITVR